MASPNERYSVIVSKRSRGGEIGAHAYSRHATKPEAMQSARKLMRRYRTSEVVVYDGDTKDLVVLRNLTGAKGRTNPSQVHHSIGYPTKAQAEKAKRALMARGGGPYKLSHRGGWWYVLGPKVGNPRHYGRHPLNTFEKNQLRVALQTLKYSDVGARIMGGPTKAEAREIIRRLTGRVVKENPAAPVEAIPAQWTRATVTTRGRQVQIRIGGRR